MIKRLLRKLSALSITFLVALAFTACVPEIHIHTGDASSEKYTASENDTIASTDESTVQNNNSQDKVETSVATSEPKQSDNNDKKEPTASKATSSKSSSSKSSSSKSSSSKSTSSKSSSSKSTSSKSSSSKSTSSKSSSNSIISESKAKSIALKDAGLKAADIYDYEIELDRDYSVLKYDISFESGGRDYDYDINATTGKIIAVEKPNATSSDAKISKSKAKRTALSHAGVKSADISRYQIKLEKDDGIWIYEISFNVGYIEYDYTINAENGKILESERDIDD